MVWESSPATKTKTSQVEIHPFCLTFNVLTYECVLALGKYQWAPSQEVLTFSTRTRMSTLSARRAVKCGFVPIKLYSHKQAVSQICMGLHLANPCFSTNRLKPGVGTPALWSAQTTALLLWWLSLLNEASHSASTA